MFIDGFGKLVYHLMISSEETYGSLKKTCIDDTLKLLPFKTECQICNYYITCKMSHSSCTICASLRYNQVAVDDMEWLLFLDTDTSPSLSDIV